MKEIYQKQKEELLKGVDAEKGLTGEKAKALLEEKGENVLMEGAKKSTLAVFLGQFADLLVIILIVAAVISIFSGNVESTIVIFAVIMIYYK